MPHSAAPAPAHTRPDARYPLVPVTIGLILLSLGLFGFGTSRHLTTQTPPTPAKAAAAAPGKTAAHTRIPHQAAAKPAPVAPPQPDTLGFQAMLAGGIGLLLSSLTGLGLFRSAQATQYRTMQSILEVERAAWEKKRSLMDAERDQLNARLRETQQRTDEIDSLRHHATRQFQEFFRTLPIACFCFAANGKIVRWNEAAEKLYGVATENALDSTLWDILVPAEERSAMEGWISRVQTGEALLDEERWDRRGDGSAALVRFSMVPLRDADNGIVGGLSAGLDITRIRNFEQQSTEMSVALDITRAALHTAQAALTAQQEEATRLQALLSARPSAAPPVEAIASAQASSADAPDKVTGLCSPRAFQERLRDETERAHRYNKPLSVLALDLDAFTRYNAAWGYAAGDAALKTAAGVIESKLRTVDVATRYSADTYVILLPETSETGARVATERLRSGIAGADWAGKPLTASCGYALLTPDVPDADTLLARALDALNRAKSPAPGRLAPSGDAPTPPRKSITRKLKKTETAETSPLG